MRSEGLSESASGSDAASVPTSSELVINSFEITSAPAKVDRHELFESPPDYALTVYFSDFVRGEQVNGKPEFLYINIDGAELTRRGVAGNRGQRFGERDLRQLSHRTGIAYNKFQEAYGELTK